MMKVNALSVLAFMLLSIVVGRVDVFRTCVIIIARRHDDERYGTGWSAECVPIVIACRIDIPFLLFLGTTTTTSHRPQSASFIICWSSFFFFFFILFFVFLWLMVQSEWEREKVRYGYKGLFKKTARWDAWTPADLSHFFENGHREGVVACIHQRVA